MVSIDGQIIVILNGVGSVGKSSTARAMQESASIPLLHFSMDAFLDMLPERMFDHPEGMVFHPSIVDGNPVVTIATGPVGQRLLSGMRQAALAMVRAGNSLIIDDVMLADEAAEYRALFRGHDLRFVRLHAPLDVLEDRERRRGDRDIGLARGQFEAINAGVGYDLEVDTSVNSPAEAARLILDAFGL